jgi:N-acylneuraminate cytidylyltransferase
MRRLAIIPARGGSKRIPRKNIKAFLGKPIIAYSIETALNSGLFDEVMVSTDDDEIAEIAQSYGAVIPFKRSFSNSDDFATTIDVILEVLNAYKAKGKVFDYGCCIYPTAPFIRKELLIRAFNDLLVKKLDTVFPVLPYSYAIQRAVKLNHFNKVEMFQSKYKNSRSQDLEAAYHDAGQFYWFNNRVLLNEKKLWTANTGAVILNEMEAQDIDTMEDWRIAEFKYKMMLNAKT